MPLLRAWLLLLMSLPVLAAAESLRLVADPWPPFTDQRLPGNGLASDLVEQALERAGYRTHYAEVPWERAVLGLKRGDYDVLINAWYSVERTRFGHFSQPYLINRIRFLQRKGGDIRFQRLADLYPHSIAVIRGYAYSKAFDNDPDLHKVGVSSFEIAARMLNAGRVELALEDELVARHQLGHSLSMLRDGLEFLPQPLSENGLHILVRLSHPEHKAIVERFDAAIQAMRDDGSYAATFRRHGF